MTDKKNDPNYGVVRGFVPQPLVKRFKFYCVENNMDNSEGLEQILSEYFQIDTKRNSSDAENQKQPDSWDTIANLVRANLPKLREAANIKNLQAIADGAKPTLADKVKLAHALDMLEEDIEALYRRSFPAKGAKEKEPNGHT